MACHIRWTNSFGNEQIILIWNHLFVYFKCMCYCVCVCVCKYAINLSILLITLFSIVLSYIKINLTPLMVSHRASFVSITSFPINTTHLTQLPSRAESLSPHIYESSHEHFQNHFSCVCSPRECVRSVYDVII